MLFLALRNNERFRKHQVSPPRQSGPLRPKLQSSTTQNEMYSASCLRDTSTNHARIGLQVVSSSGLGAKRAMLSTQASLKQRFGWEFFTPPIDCTRGPQPSADVKISNQSLFRKVVLRRLNFVCNKCLNGLSLIT